MFDVNGKRVFVAGLGISGIAAVKVASKRGAIITVFDQKAYEKIDEETKAVLEHANATILAGGQMPEPDARFDYAILSPGMPPDSELPTMLRENGAEILGELELAYRMGKGNFVGITGTNGKTTTTTLTGEIFRQADRATEIVGNIGKSVALASDEATDDTWLITEVSSFQLETTKFFKPKVSAILNITPDHMDRHKTMENYADAKAKIVENQDKNDYFVVNADEPLAFSVASKSKAQVVPFSRTKKLEFGALVQDDEIVIRDGAKQVRLCKLDELIIPGAHNVENALAASAIGYFAGIDETDIRQALITFRGVEHRLELVDEINGVRFVNDSKGTNPDASMKAIEAIKPGIFLIAGGYNKNADFSEFIQSFGGKVRHLLLMGETSEKIKNTANEFGFMDVTVCGDMETCVSTGFNLATEGDTVLLSPANASWDMYKSYEERGNHFKRCVEGLKD